MLEETKRVINNNPRLRDYINIIILAKMVLILQLTGI